MVVVPNKKISQFMEYENAIFSLPLVCFKNLEQFKVGRDFCVTL